MAKVDELSAQLKDERLKSLELEKQLQSASISRMRMEQVSQLTHLSPLYRCYTVSGSPVCVCTQLQERISELEQERDLLKESNEKLLNR